MNKFLVLFLLAFSLSIYDIHAECADSLALTPPMGWSSWNCFNSDISEQKIREIADFMVSTGMKDAGYEYLNSKLYTSYSDIPVSIYDHNQ